MLTDESSEKQMKMKKSENYNEKMSKFLHCKKGVNKLFSNKIKKITKNIKLTSTAHEHFDVSELVKIHKKVRQKYWFVAFNHS